MNLQMKPIVLRSISFFCYKLLNATATQARTHTHTEKRKKTKFFFYIPLLPLSRKGVPVFKVNQVEQNTEGCEILKTGPVVQFSKYGSEKKGTTWPNISKHTSKSRNYSDAPLILRE